MPELPEVETICRGLAHHCIGARVLAAHIHRSSFVQGPQTQEALLSGLTIFRVHRHGKQFALESKCGRVLLFHMGMSGCVTVAKFGSKRAPHVHVHWTLTRNGKKFELHHKDPRRFGYLHTYKNMATVQSECWSSLGPDALVITAKELFETFKGRKRAIKSALLDQSITAGIGNIYADETLFQAKIHPLRQAKSLRMDELNVLVSRLQIILNGSIQEGGSTIQDHQDASGRPGTYQDCHQVYGRAKQPCLICNSVLRNLICQQRSTVYCPTCQPRRSQMKL